MYIDQAMNAMRNVAASYEEERSANDDLPELLFLYQGSEVCI